MNIISVENVQKKINGNNILQDISLKLSTGKCYGFIGNNGSGKSMLLKCICGFIRPDSGTIFVQGKRIIGGKNFIENAGVLIETPEWMNNLTGLMNLQILAEIRGVISDREIIEAIEKVGLSEVKDKKVKKYSLGMKQRLRIAQAIMENPEILVLDEPFNGLDRAGIIEIQQLLNGYKEKGKSILLTSHDERQIDFLCDEVFELSEGKII